MTNLASLWEGLGSQDGAKLAPNRFKNDSPNPAKKRSHFESLLGPILIDFWLQLSSQEGAQEIIFRCFLHRILPNFGPKLPPGQPWAAVRTRSLIFVDFGVEKGPEGRDLNAPGGMRGGPGA